MNLTVILKHPRKECIILSSSSCIIIIALIIIVIVIHQLMIKITLHRFHSLIFTLCSKVKNIIILYTFAIFNGSILTIKLINYKMFPVVLISIKKNTQHNINV